MLGYFTKRPKATDNARIFYQEATDYGSGEWSDEDSHSQSQNAEMGEKVGHWLRKQPPSKKAALKSPQKLERPKGKEKKFGKKNERSMDK